jgi:hypothetical protein
MAEIKVEDVAQDKVEAETVPEDGGAATEEAEDAWDEERLEKAMDTLKEMYIQVRALSYFIIHLFTFVIVTGTAVQHSKARCPTDR